MRRHLNTLYVTTQKSYLAAEGETVVVKVGGDVRLRVPLHMLENIVCFGNVGASPFLLGRCAERSIGFAFLTERGRFLARMQSAVSGNVLLRRQQYRWADSEKRSAQIAAVCVAAKLANCRRVVQRRLRDRSATVDRAPLEKVERGLAKSISRIAASATVALDTVRGIEGDAARAYFGIFEYLLTTETGFGFPRRSRRPPMDPANALLSFVYTLILHDVGSALGSVGLDPQVGFLHRDRPGRPGLALDLMEEFRPFLADRLVLSLVNRRQVSLKHFEERETGGVWLNDPGREIVLRAYQERKGEELLHPFLQERVTVGMFPHVQALLFARFIRGDLDAYPAFFWK